MVIVFIITVFATASLSLIKFKLLLFVALSLQKIRFIDKVSKLQAYTSLRVVMSFWKYNLTSLSQTCTAMLVRVHDCTHTQAHRHRHTDTDTQRHTHRDRQTDKHTHTHTHSHTHTHTHTHPHTHTHTHTHTHQGKKCERSTHVPLTSTTKTAGSVQFSPLTDWVVGWTRGTIQQRSSSSLFYRRPLWAVLA